MKKWKLTAVILFSVILVQMLIGCGTVPVGTDPTTTESLNTTNTTTKGTEATEPEPNIKVQYLPKTVENPDNLPVLKWVCMVERRYGGGNRTWSENAVVTLNQMLADEELPFRVQFAVVTGGQLLNDVDWFSQSQVQELLKDADLIYSVMKESEVTEYLVPITDHVTGVALPNISSAVPHEVNWITASGEIYGLTTVPICAVGKGWKVNSELMTQCGLTQEDFEKDYWEMDGVFQKIYSQWKRPFMRLPADSYGQTFTPYLDELPAGVPSCYDLFPVTLETVGSCFAIDHSGDSPKVINILEADAVRSIQQAILRYREKGYYLSDTALISDPGLEKISYTKTAEITAYTDDEDLYIPRTELAVVRTDPCGPVTGVAEGSQHKEEAVMLLNLIGENESFRMQMFHGKEGQDYKIVDGYYTIITQSDGSSYSLSMLSPLSYFSGLTADRSVSYFENPGTENWEFHAINGKTALQTYQQALDHATVFYYPIRFDYSGFEDELSAIEEVSRKYFSFFTNYMDIGEPEDPDYVPKMTEKVYEHLLQQYKDAGTEKIIAALQRQLDEWLAEHPEWNSESGSHTHDAAH